MCLKDESLNFEQNPEDTSMKDALDRADAFKVVLKTDDVLPADPPVDKCVYEKYCMSFFLHIFSFTQVRMSFHFSKNNF